MIRWTGTLAYINTSCEYFIFSLYIYIYIYIYIERERVVGRDMKQLVYMAWLRIGRTEMPLYLDSLYISFLYMSLRWAQIFNPYSDIFDSKQKEDLRRNKKIKIKLKKQDATTFSAEWRRRWLFRRPFLHPRPPPHAPSLKSSLHLHSSRYLWSIIFI